MKRPTSLSVRVALAATASVALGALLAATLTLLVLDQRLREDAEQRLRSAADGVIRELSSKEAEREAELAPVLERRNAEGAHTGIRLAAFEDRKFVAGDRWVRRMRRARCKTRGDLGAEVQSCGRKYRQWIIVASSARDEGALQLAYLWSLLSAVSVSVLLGGVSSWAVARWAAAPVVKLAKSVRELRAEAPSAESLMTPARVAEVEALRVALVDLVERARSHLERVERFAANAAHELSTPLAVLRAELDLLAEEHGADLGARLSRAAQRATDLATLIERLLQLTSPADIDRFDSPVSLADVVERVIARLPAELAARVRVDAASEALVFGDEALLETMVHNALENALKFSTEPVQLSVEEAPPEAADAPMLRVRIVDRGPGIPEDLRERAFEPFFRAKRDATPGHGLGLALLRSIARTHGGDARFLDTSSGTALEIELPACDTQLEPLP